MLVTQPVHAWGMDVFSKGGMAVHLCKGCKMNEDMSLEERVAKLEYDLRVEKTANSLVFSALIQAVNDLYPGKNVREAFDALIKDKLNPERVENIPVMHEAFQEAAKILGSKKAQ